MVFLDLLDRIAAIDGRAHDLEIRLGLEKVGQHFPHEGGVVSDEDSDHPASPLEHFRDFQ